MLYIIGINKVLIDIRKRSSQKNIDKVLEKESNNNILKNNKLEIIG